MINYTQYINSPEWKARAKRARMAAGNRCQVCNSGLRLNVHHRTYDRLGREAEGDLTVLCRSCHELFEKDLPTPPFHHDPGPSLDDQRLWELRETWLDEVGLSLAA